MGLLRRKRENGFSCMMGLVDCFEFEGKIEIPRRKDEDNEGLREDLNEGD